jgi:hypothetical protein
MAKAPAPEPDAGPSALIGTSLPWRYALLSVGPDWWDIANRRSHLSHRRMQPARTVIFRLLRRLDDHGRKFGVVVGRDIPRYGER